MKRCKYCETVNPDAATKCKQCGATEFVFTCNNCGTTFEKGFCPNCGVRGGVTEKTCPKCGERYFSAACPACGYTPARESSRAVQEQPTVIIQQSRPEKKKGTFGKVLLWIFFLPVMAIITIWKAKKLPKVLKIIFTAIIGFITLLYFVGALQTENETAKKDAETTSTATAKPQKEATNTPEATNSLATGDIDRDAIVSQIEDALKDAYGDNYTIQYDEDSASYAIGVWSPGIVQAAALAKAGDENSMNNWSKAKDALCQICVATRELAVKSGDKDANVLFSLLNDSNTELSLVMIMNGTVIYDAVESGS